MGQGKPVTQGSRLVAYAIDKLSKNALADIVIDQARLSVGCEDATDEQILAVLQSWSEPIARVRGDSRVDLAAVGKRLLASDARYRAAMGTRGDPTASALGAPGAR